MTTVRTPAVRTVDANAARPIEKFSQAGIRWQNWSPQNASAPSMLVGIMIPTIEPGCGHAREARPQDRRSGRESARR